MNHLEVWAPYADTVAARIKDRTHPLKASTGGWWHLSEPVAANEDYAFIINDGKPLPDPRSAQLPYGVHGPSRQVDHSAFTWHDGGWRAPPLSSAIIYELHVGTFSKEGTFDGVIRHLDYLCDLGITHVELMPVNTFSGNRGWGYDGVGLYAPQETYGGPDGLKRLVDTCHGKGLSVILDVVYNHLGPEGNYLNHFGPYFTDHYSSPWGEAVNLDGSGSFEVRRFFVENALMWLRDYHIDGLRIDAVHTLVDMSAIHFLEELAEAVKRLEAETGRHLVVIAESDLNNPRVVTPVAAGGYGMDAQWSDDFHHALHALLTGEKAGYYSDFGKIEDLARALTRVFVYDGRYSSYRHRNHGRPVEGLPGTCFLGYIQTHDQVGNRAKGDRISQLVQPEKLKIGAAIVLFSPFVPMLFQGEEWGAATPFCYFSGHEDKDLGEAVRKGRLGEFAGFGWDPAEIPDPQALETYTQSILDWDERENEPHRSLLDWYRRLIALRKKSIDLKDGRMNRITVTHDENNQWLVISRGTLLLACNLNDKKQMIPIPAKKQATSVLLSTNNVEIVKDAVILPPFTAAIMLMRQSEESNDH